MSKRMFILSRASDIENAGRNIASLPQSDARDNSIRKLLEGYLELAYDAGAYDAQSQLQRLTDAARTFLRWYLEGGTGAPELALAAVLAEVEGKNGGGE